MTSGGFPVRHEPDRPSTRGHTADLRVPARAQTGASEYALSLTRRSHYPLLPHLLVDGLGHVSVLSDAPDLWVVPELLLQLLVVVGGLPLSVGQLQDNTEGYSPSLTTTGTN